MSREIKFRAWNKKGKCWITFGGVNCRYENGILDIVDSDNLIYEQFTGLLDRNGKKIYEGDVVSELVGDYRCSTAIKGVIEQHEGSWAIRWDDTRNGYSQLYYEQTVCEVIGNIHENSELLGGEE